MIRPLSEETKTTLTQISAFSDSDSAKFWLNWTEINLKKHAELNTLYREVGYIRRLDTTLRVLVAASLGFGALFQFFSYLQVQNLPRLFPFASQACPLLVGCSYLFCRYGIVRTKKIEDAVDQIEESLCRFAVLSQIEIPKIEKFLTDRIAESEGESGSSSKETTEALQDLQRLKADLIREGLISAKELKASPASDLLPQGKEESEDSSH